MPAPGGNSIVGYVSKTIVAVLDWGRTAQEASALPNIVARGPVVSIETADEKGRQWSKILTDSGFKVREVAGENSGLNLIVVILFRLFQRRIFFQFFFYPFFQIGSRHLQQLH